MKVSELIKEACAKCVTPKAVVLHPSDYADLRSRARTDERRDCFDLNCEAKLLQLGIFGWLAGTPASPLVICVSPFVVPRQREWLIEEEYLEYLWLGEFVPRGSL